MKVYLAPTRPKLRRGAEWKLSTINGLFSLLLLVTALISHAWWVLGAAALLYWPGRWICARRRSMIRSGSPYTRVL